MCRHGHAARTRWHTCARQSRTRAGPRPRTQRDTHSAQSQPRTGLQSGSARSDLGRRLCHRGVRTPPPRKTRLPGTDHRVLGAPPGSPARGRRLWPAARTCWRMWCRRCRTQGRRRPHTPAGTHTRPRRSSQHTLPQTGTAPRGMGTAAGLREHGTQRPASPGPTHQAPSSAQQTSLRAGAAKAERTRRRARRTGHGRERDRHMADVDGDTDPASPRPSCECGVGPSTAGCARARLSQPAQATGP